MTPISLHQNNKKPKVKVNDQNQSDASSVSESFQSHSYSDSRSEINDLCIPPKFDKGNLWIFHLNCQSIRGKKSELAIMINYTKPNIVCATESYLYDVKAGNNPDNDAIKSSKI